MGHAVSTLSHQHQHGQSLESKDSGFKSIPPYGSSHRNSKHSRALAYHVNSKTATRALSVSVLALLCLAAVPSASASTPGARPASASIPTQKASCSVPRNAAFLHLSVKSRPLIRPRHQQQSAHLSTFTSQDHHYTNSPQSCFHFLSNNDGNNSSCSKQSSFQKEHFNDALLNRIIRGRSSSSPRWRKRTRRAAAALGIQRRYRDWEDTEEHEEIDLDCTGNSASRQQGFQNLYQDGYDQEMGTAPLHSQFVTRPVPPLTSTLTILKSNTANASSAYSPVTTMSSSSSQPLSTQPKKLQIQTFYKRQKKLTQEQHSRAKLEWAAKYTSIDTLRHSFGQNRNKLWGDFDAKTTRKLYHTLLPRALLGLYEMDLWSPADLAPLAFEARIAAKKYARERCILPGRVAAMVYDGFRSWRTWGTWSFEGMSWEQVWDKYETQILEEYMEDHRGNIDLDLLQEEITAQICVRILERSCNTNEAVDRMFLEDEDGNSERNSNLNADNALEKDGKKLQIGMRRRNKRNAERDLARIKIKLDRDIEELLGPNKQLQPVLPFWDILSQLQLPSHQFINNGNIYANTKRLDQRGGANGIGIDLVLSDIFLLSLTAGKENFEAISEFFPLSMIP